MDPILKIDIHAHATPFPDYCPRNPKGERNISVEELMGEYDKLGIEKGVLLPLTAAEGMLTTIPTETCKRLQPLAEKPSGKSPATSSGKALLSPQPQEQTSVQHPVAQPQECAQAQSGEMRV